MNLARLIKPITLSSKLGREGPDSTLHPHHPIVPPRHMTTHGRSYFADLEPEPSPDIQFCPKPFQHSIQPQKGSQPSSLKQNASLQGQNQVQEHASMDRHQLRPSAAPGFAKLKVTTGKEESVLIKQQEAEVIVVDPYSLFQESQSDKGQSDKLQSQCSGEGSEDGQKQKKNSGSCPCSLSAFMTSVKQQLNTLALRAASLQRENQELSQKKQQAEEHISNTFNHIASQNKKLIPNTGPAILKEPLQKSLRERPQLYNNKAQTDLQPMKSLLPIKVTPSKADRPAADTPSRSKVETLLKRLQLRIEKS